MNAELVLLGKRVDMARRARRRVLVAAIYVCLAALMAIFWFVDHWRATSPFLIFAAMGSCQLFLGGYYRGGLVKPFNGKGPRPETAQPSGLMALGLAMRIYRPSPEADNSSYRNDEWELARRDRAHYSAYQVAAMAPILLWFIEYLKLEVPRLGARIPSDQLIYGLLLISIVVFMTLPQSILLWTEPDMDAAGNGD